MNKFTFENYKKIFQKVKDSGYKVVTCYDFITNHKKYKKQKIVINRIDVDSSFDKAKKACDIFNELDITVSIFIRLHEYNLLSFENYLYLDYIKKSKFEIGLHSEIMDCAKEWNENPADCLFRDMRILQLLDIQIKGTAGHNGLTGVNNLDFWKYRKPKDFGLVYEAYDPILFNNFYTSDSPVIEWKCYREGELVDGDKRWLDEHLEDNHNVIYCLTHPEQYK